MFKVLIVDDEIYVVVLIQKLIHWEDFQMKVEATANDGITALRLVKEIKPDLVIVDVRMPGYDGISFMDKVREFNTDVRFIVISGHKEFEYAKGAMRNNVEDYLLKPINKEELEKVLKHVNQQLLEVQQKEYKIKEMEEELDTSKKLIREKLIELIDAGEYKDISANLDYVNQKFKTKFQRGSFCLLCFVTDTPIALIENVNNDRMFGEMRIDLKNTLLNFCWEVVEAELQNRTVYLVNYEESQENELHVMLRKRMSVYVSQIRKFGNLSVNICVGRSCKNISEIETSAESMKKCILGRTAIGTNRTIEAADVKEGESIFSAIWELRNERLHQALELLDIDEISLCIKEMFSKAFYGIEEDSLLYYKLFMKVAEYLFHYFSDIGVCREKWEEFEQRYYDQFILAPNAGEYSRILSGAARQMIEMLSQLSDYDQTTPTVRIVKNYIREHYQEKITLTSAAHTVNISSVYLSRLFKKEEGINFVDYLNQYRIEVSKKLLKEAKCNIIEVAEESGFVNTRYFSKIFKKNVGLTPSEYRKRHLGKDVE